MYIVLYQPKNWKGYEITLGLFKWFGFSIIQPTCVCCDYFFINLGFVCFDFKRYYAEH